MNIWHCFFMATFSISPAAASCSACWVKLRTSTSNTAIICLVHKRLIWKKYIYTVYIAFLFNCLCLLYKGIIQYHLISEPLSWLKYEQSTTPLKELYVYTHTAFILFPSPFITSKLCTFIHVYAEQLQKSELSFGAHLFRQYSGSNGASFYSTLAIFVGRFVSILIQTI